MTDGKIRIAVDAMGGDHFPDVLVEGSISALGRFSDVEIVLVGDERMISDCVNRYLALDRKSNPFD